MRRSRASPLPLTVLLLLASACEGSSDAAPPAPSFDAPAAGTLHVRPSGAEERPEQDEETVAFELRAPEPGQLEANAGLPVATLPGFAWEAIAAATGQEWTEGPVTAPRGDPVPAWLQAAPLQVEPTTNAVVRVGTKKGPPRMVSLYLGAHGGSGSGTGKAAPEGLDTATVRVSEVPKDGYRVLPADRWQLLHTWGFRSPDHTIYGEPDPETGEAPIVRHTPPGPATYWALLVRYRAGTAGK